MSSMCSMPTQRSDSGGSPAASSDGTSALTTGPRTVERMVSACGAAPRTLMSTLPLVECAPGVAVAIAPRIARIDLLDIQVARRGHVVGDRPGDAAVAAPPHAGETRDAPRRRHHPPARAAHIRTSSTAPRTADADRRTAPACRRRCDCHAPPSCCCRSHRRCRRACCSTRCSEASGVRYSARNASGSSRAASAATMRSMRPFSDHQMPRAIATTSRTVNGSGA